MSNQAGVFGYKKFKRIYPQVLGPIIATIPAGLSPQLFYVDLNTVLANQSLSGFNTLYLHFSEALPGGLDPNIYITWLYRPLNVPTLSNVPAALVNQFIYNTGFSSVQKFRGVNLGTVGLPNWQSARFVKCETSQFAVGCDLLINTATISLWVANYDVEPFIVL